ncbi:MAG TPA: hypothetical protein VIC33_14360 [Vicinamibacterales bacterium]|jgi:hypothetical protein
MRVRFGPLSLLVLATALSGGCQSPRHAPDGQGARSSASVPRVLNRAAQSYVTWTLAFGELTAGGPAGSAGYLDQPYYGPPAWDHDADVTPTSVRRIETQAAQLADRLADDAAGQDGERRRFLEAQLRSLSARARMVASPSPAPGFDAEATTILGVAPPPFSAAAEQEARRRLDVLLPGHGPLAARYVAFERRLLIPAPHLPAVIDAAVQGCRAQTQPHVPLPPDEHLEIEYVSGEAWNADAEYRAHDRSVMRVDVDHPMTVERALELACHEGYPGHHVFDLLADQRLVKGKGWQELTLRPASSPAGFAAEAVASFAPDVAFPGASRVAFERDVLAPLAGISGADLERADQIRQATDALAPAIVAIARDYLDGRLDAASARRALAERAAQPDPEAMLRFIDRYRTYVIAYTMGRQLVRQYVESRGGTVDQPDRRWKIYGELLGQPVLPKDLR